MSGAHKSVSKNRALRKGRDNIFERKAPKSNFQPTQKEEETPLQIRQKFRNNCQTNGRLTVEIHP